jgi:hypothetical protein
VPELAGLRRWLRRVADTGVHGQSVAPGASSGPSPASPPPSPSTAPLRISSAAPVYDARGGNWPPVEAGNDLPLGGEEVVLAKAPS